jgi:hypothetical protein
LIVLNIGTLQFPSICLTFLPQVFAQVFARLLLELLSDLWAGAG